MNTNPNAALKNHAGGFNRAVGGTIRSSCSTYRSSTSSPAGSGSLIRYGSRPMEGGEQIYENRFQVQTRKTDQGSASIEPERLRIYYICVSPSGDLPTECQKGIKRG